MNLFLQVLIAQSASIIGFIAIDTFSAIMKAQTADESLVTAVNLDMTTQLTVHYATFQSAELKVHSHLAVTIARLVCDVAFQTQCIKAMENHTYRR